MKSLVYICLLATLFGLGNAVLGFGKKKIANKTEEFHIRATVKIYELMIEVDSHDKNYFNVCQHYKHYYETPRIKQDSEKMKQALKNVVLYLILSPYDNEQSDFLHRVFLDKNLEEIPKYK